jgi:tetratricopeptide (TPR) repeat protein
MDSSLTAGRPTTARLRDRAGRVYVPAVGPRLKVLLAFIFAAVALLGATGAYLTAIRLLEWWRGQTYTNAFSLWMFVAHQGVGMVFVAPFLLFGFVHLASARKRPNRVAVRLGILLFIVGILVCLTGLALLQLDFMPQLPTSSVSRWVVYALHLLTPVVAIYLYVLHRRAGPDIRWKWGYAWGGGVGLFIVAMVVLHSQDPRKWNVEGPKEGAQYFYPSESRTAGGTFIPAGTLMMDTYCMKCHQDIYNNHFHSAHKFSSFNNPAYLSSVRETREVSLKRDGNVKASRWCAGCHDPVPFFSGAFDKPDFDDVNDPTAHAGITCTVCHAITHVDAPIGNGAYTIEEPEHYPFAKSENPFLQWVNNQVLKAKPDFHKKTFLKPLHKSAEFCSTCHKVNLPVALNYYKEWLRGQNHYDAFLLSGVKHGARSFYYPEKGKDNCAACHMPLQPSNDFGSRDFDESGIRKVHDHGFPGANTGLFELLKREPRYAGHTEGFDAAIKKHADFLRGTDPDGKDRKLRIDLFGIKKGQDVDGELIAPLRPELPKLKPGQTYLVEVVIRTVNIGHPFSQGTVDSNEIWVDFQVKASGKTIGRNGALAQPDDSGPVDEWVHFVNVLMLDRDGNRINRRNPQDIFTPLYDHQIPPGAAQVVHYKLEVPKDVAGPIELKVRLRYRKFDYEYMKIVHKDKDVPKLPIVDVCEDQVTLPVEGVADAVPAQTSPIKPPWQRWNDYGIALFLEGGLGNKKGELVQAEQAFQRLLKLGVKDAERHAHVNLARIYIELGGAQGEWLDKAARELNEAAKADPPADWWTLAWFNGLVNAQNTTEKKHLDAAIADFERIVDPDKQPRSRGLDFSKDYVVLDMLGGTLFKRSQMETDNPTEQRRFLLRAVEAFERTLAIDPEDLDAHYGLSQCYARLGEDAKEAKPSASPPVDGDELLALVERIAAGKDAGETKLEAIADLAAGLDVFVSKPTDPQKPKLPTLRTLIVRVREAFQAEKDDGARAALAQVQAVLHLKAHAIFKPDELARSRTAQEYRAKHPAANAAAEAIVIYPTRRPGAPGF